MARLAHFTFTLAVILFLISVGGSSTTVSTVRAIQPPAAVAREVRSDAVTPSSQYRRTRETREPGEDKPLAWVLLLLKQGRGAR